MWLFKGSTETIKIAEKKTYVFDWDKLGEMEKLTPREIVVLLCCAIGTNPATTCTLYEGPPHPEVMHLFKEYTGES